MRRGHYRDWRGRRAAAVVIAAVGLVGLASAKSPRATPVPKQMPITDANVADRVLAARTKADQRALADYYAATAKSEEARIDHYDRLFRAYMQLEGKDAEPLQRQARLLLKAARMTKQHDELLAQAHRNRSYQDETRERRDAEPFASAR